MLTFRAGDPDRPRGHALLFFHDADEPDGVWATYLVVAPIAMDLAKYIPAAFAPQLGAQMGAQGPTAYPLPPMPEKIEGGLTALERLAELRSDDLLDGGVLRVSEPWQALQPVTEIGREYAERHNAFLDQAPAAAEQGVLEQGGAGSAFDVDNLLLQVMPDREKIEKLARLAGTLRYAVEGRDGRLASETLAEMDRVGRHLGDKYQVTALLEAANSPDVQAGQLAQLYIERCYKLADEDYAALGDLDRRIESLRANSPD